MTAALSNSPEAEALAGMGRDQYLGFKLKQDLKMMAWMFVFCWITGFVPARSFAYLAAFYLVILAAARFDHGRKWDRAHAIRPSPASIRPPGE